MAVSWLSILLALVGLAKTLGQLFLGRSERETWKERRDADAKAGNHDLLLKALKARRRARKVYLDGNPDVLVDGDKPGILPGHETGKE